MRTADLRSRAVVFSLLFAAPAACRSVPGSTQNDGSSLAADTSGAAAGSETFQQTLPADAADLSQGIAHDHASFTKAFIDLRKQMLNAAQHDTVFNLTWRILTRQATGALSAKDVQAWNDQVQVLRNLRNAIQVRYMALAGGVGGRKVTPAEVQPLMEPYDRKIHIALNWIGQELDTTFSDVAAQELARNEAWLADSAETLSAYVVASLADLVPPSPELARQNAKLLRSSAAENLRSTAEALGEVWKGAVAVLPPMLSSSLPPSDSLLDANKTVWGSVSTLADDLEAWAGEATSGAGLQLADAKPAKLKPPRDLQHYLLATIPVSGVGVISGFSAAVNGPVQQVGGNLRIFTRKFPVLTGPGQACSGITARYQHFVANDHILDIRWIYGLSLVLRFTSEQQDGIVGSSFLGGLGLGIGVGGDVIKPRWAGAGLGGALTYLPLKNSAIIDAYASTGVTIQRWIPYLESMPIVMGGVGAELTYESCGPHGFVPPAEATGAGALARLLVPFVNPPSGADEEAKAWEKAVEIGSQSAKQ